MLIVPAPRFERVWADLTIRMRWALAEKIGETALLMKRDTDALVTEWLEEALSRAQEECFARLRDDAIAELKMN